MTDSDAPRKNVAASARERLAALNTELAIIGSELQRVGHPDDEATLPIQAAFRHLADASSEVFAALEFLEESK